MTHLALRRTLTKMMLMRSVTVANTMIQKRQQYISEQDIMIQALEDSQAEIL